MGGCCTATNPKEKGNRKSQSAGQPIAKGKNDLKISRDGKNSSGISKYDQNKKETTDQGIEGRPMLSNRSNKSINGSLKKEHQRQASLQKGGNTVEAKPTDPKGQSEIPSLAQLKKKSIPTFDISPKIVRQFRIYNVQSNPPIQVPYSKHQEWQQVLNLYQQKLNMSSFQTNLGNGSFRNRKSIEIETHLAQVQMHREIELMEKILNMRNRNWMREQIKMCRRLAAMQPGSFDSLVVTREYLQLKEHFNWLVWAVGFYYFQMSKIEQFFQYCQQREAKSKEQQASQASGGGAKSGGQGSQRAKLQSQHYQEIARLMDQIKGLKTKLPSPISKKWTEGFNFQGIFVRMLPYSDSYFVRNEIKALKYMQNELMELSQLQNQLGDLAASGSFLGQQQPQTSMYKSLILPLLAAVECGGFLIFASPTIHIEDYDDDSHLLQDREVLGAAGSFKGSKTPRGPGQAAGAQAAMGTKGDISNNVRGLGRKNSPESPPRPGNADLELALQHRKNQQGERRRALTMLYGTGVHQNRKTMMRKLQNKQKERSYSFLQDNIDEIDDPLLKMMPLLRNLTKENLIPIIDFEDPTQVDLNYLLLHVYDCLPSVGRKSSEFATAVLQIPSDPSAEVSFINEDLNVTSATVSDIRKALRYKSGGGPQNQKEERKERKGAQRRAGGQATPIRDQNNPFSYPSQLKTPQQVYKNEGGDQNDFSDESSLVCESDYDRSRGDSALDDPAELFDSKCFTKHGFDLLMISNNIPNLLALQKLQTPPNKKDPPEAGASSGVGAVGSEHYGTSHLVANKRAQALFAAREEESHYSGLSRQNQSPYLESIVQFQASLVENTAAASGGFVVGGGKATHAVGQSLVRSQASSKKHSILRKVNSTGFSYGYGGGAIPGFESGSGVPGVSSMFGPDASEQQQITSEGAAIQGNALLVAQSSASEFKLKYPLINHSHDPCLEQIFLATLDHIAQIIDTTDTIHNVQSLKDLLHRKGLNLRFEWILLSKLRQSQGRQLVMIHILVRVMKRIINEEMKLKAQVFAPSKPKPLSLAAPKSLADHQKQSQEQAKQSARDSRRPCDHFIGNHYETFKDTLVFFSNTLLRRKFSKQKHVFDETLIGLFLNRLKAFPILNAMINFNKNSQSRPSLVRDYEANYVKSKNILEDIISAPSQNPALYLNALQNYFDVDIDSEFLRRCRQDKCAFLSQLTSQPMVLNNIQSVNLKNHSYYSLKEYAYFMLANQISKFSAEEKRDQARLSQLDGDSRASILTANQNLRSNIFRNQFQPKVSRNTNEDLLNSSMRSTQSIRGATAQASHQVYDDANSVASEQKMQRQNIMNQNGRGNPIGPMGGAPGRRESLAQFSNLPGQGLQQNEILNSSTITDRNKARLHGGIAGHPLEIAQLGDQSVVSRSSALASQVVNATRGGYPREAGTNLARANQPPGAYQERQTPRQFNNIDGLDLRNHGPPSQIDFQRDLPRQSPQILGLEKLKISGAMSNQPAPNSRPAGSELLMPPVLYKLNCRQPGDACFESRGQVTSNLLPYYFMPSQHVFNTWVMYLESILKEVHSVEGSEQILLEALNYLALNIYFDGQKEATKTIGSPGSPMTPDDQRDLMNSQRFGRKHSNIGSEDLQGIFDRDQFVKVCSKIKEVQAFTSKCSPEVLALSQIMCGLNFELALDDSLFPIESEKSYLTALICLFQIIGDPRGRGNFSIPFMLLITWKLSLMSLSLENRKVHDAEFSEELFDATLTNLSNHQMLFRGHQNDKLNRAQVQQDKLDQQNLLNALSKESAIEQKRKPGAIGGGNTFNSRRSNHNGALKDNMYRITAFEERMDRESRKRARFDIKKYKNSNIATFGQVTEKSSGRWEVSRKVPGHPLTTQQTPRAGHQQHSGALNNMQSLQQSQVVYAGGFKNIGQKAENAGQMGINVSQSYQGHAGGFKSILTQSAAPQLNALGPGTKQANRGFGLQSGATAAPQTNAGPVTLALKPGQAESNRVSRLSVLAGGQQQRQQQNQKDLHSLLEANISDIELDFGEEQDEGTENNSRMLGPTGPSQLLGGAIYDFSQANFSEDSLGNPEVPFPHWSIYRQSVQNLLIQQGHKFQRNQKQLNKFLSQMYRNVLFTAVDKKILYPWFVKYNPMMYQSGQSWKNNQIKQAVFFQSAQMVSSRSSSKSFQKNESEYSLSLSMQGSLMSQGGSQSFRTGSKSQNLGSYSSIINTENGSINKGDMHGVLYSWGSDAQGQLGHDSFAHLTLRPVSQKILYPRMLSVLKDEFIKDVCCGYAHTHAITNGGLVYSWGNNECGQLGLGPEAPTVVRKPKLIEGLRSIVKLSAGNEHSAAINKNQELFTWGSMYQTGQDDRENRTVPRKVETLSSVRIHQVACGGLHTLALSKDNKIYCWGSTEGGQLGLPSDIISRLCKNEENAVTRPQLLTSLQEQQVIQAACGETHSICLCKDGSIFGWGLSLYGQLGLGFSSDSFEPGLGQEKSKVPEPRRIETLKDEQVVKIFCGSTFSLFLTKTGELYGCGMNDLGQLGEDAFNDISALENARMGQHQTSDVTIPTQVSSLQGIQLNAVACGEGHVLAIDGDGKDQRNMLWAWGQHKAGQLGLGEMNTKMNPRPIQSLASGKIQRVGAGSAHSLAVLGDAADVTTLSSNFYAGNEILSNSWSVTGLDITQNI